MRCRRSSALRGLSAGDFEAALTALLGKDAANLSPSAIARLKGEWEGEHRRWRQRDLSARRSVDVWADGAYLQARMEPRAECMLVRIGATPEGKKEPVGLQTGVRERAQSWAELEGTARRAEGAWAETSAGSRRRRRRARLLKGARRSLPVHPPSTLRGP